MTPLDHLTWNLTGLPDINPTTGRQTLTVTDLTKYALTYLALTIQTL